MRRCVERNICRRSRHSITRLLGEETSSAIDNDVVEIRGQQFFTRRVVTARETIHIAKDA